MVFFYVRTLITCLLTQICFFPEKMTKEKILEKSEYVSRSLFYARLALGE